jgi:hypothetical protein
MKKIILFFIMSIFIISSCMFIEPIDGDDNETTEYQQYFYISDTLGNTDVIILSGQSFPINYGLINNSEDTLVYYMGDACPPIVFLIYRDGERVASSIDGFGFIQIPYSYNLLPGDTLKSIWKAPKTPARGSNTILAPGSYEVGIEYPHFEPGKEIDTLQNINFTITPNPDLVVPEFTLTDTLGISDRYFNSGELFNLDFILVNTSPDTMFYTKYDSGPDVRFEIILDDSVVASSMDGYGAYQMVEDAFLAPNDTMSGHWLAPTTPEQDPKITLASGLYKATVSYPDFDGPEVNPVDEILFLINY